jgi:desulfoferrodoxin-like iron-binding protein
MNLFSPISNLKKCSFKGRNFSQFCTEANTRKFGFTCQDGFFVLILLKGGIFMSVKSIGEKYRCNVCGNQVTVTKVGGGTLVCCNQEMQLLGSHEQKAVDDEIPA